MVYSDWNLNGSKDLFDSYMNYRMSNIKCEVERPSSVREKKDAISFDEKNEKLKKAFRISASAFGYAFGLVSFFSWLLMI